MTEKLFETALGISAPWYVAGTDFDAQARTLTIRVDFAQGSRFAVAGAEGEHPVHDTVSKRYRHLNFFQHECFLEVRVPRVHLPDGAVRQVEPGWAGKLSGFTLLFEAWAVRVLQAATTVSAAAGLLGISWDQAHGIMERAVDRCYAAGWVRTWNRVRRQSVPTAFLTLDRAPNRERRSLSTRGRRS